MNTPKSFLNYHALTNVEVQDFLNKNNIKGEVIMREEKPTKDNIVINLDDIEGMGTHWTSVYKDNGKVYYFDSFGVQPPEEQLTAFKNEGNRVFYSDSKIQPDDSILCGYYCCLFLYWMNKGKTFYDFIYKFKQNGQSENDKLLKKIFESSKEVEGEGIQDTITKVQNRETAKDVFYTPEALAKDLIPIVPLKHGDVVLDPFRGGGAFYNNYPKNVKREWMEIEEGKDFFASDKQVDWIVSNPPFSLMTDVFEHSIKICKKGFAYVMGALNLTPKRIDIAKEGGFHITKMHIYNVDKWVGASYFVVFEKKSTKPKTDLTYKTGTYKADEGREVRGEGFDLVEEAGKIFEGQEWHLRTLTRNDDGELTLRKHNFTGPFTDLEKKIENWDEIENTPWEDLEIDDIDLTDPKYEGVNDVDKNAMMHDIHYTLIHKNYPKEEQLDQIHKADKILGEASYKIMKDGKQDISTRVEGAFVSLVMKLKTTFGLGKKLDKRLKELLKFIKQHQMKLSEGSQKILLSLLTHD